MGLSGVSAFSTQSQKSLFPNALKSFETMTEKAKNMRLSEALKNNKRADGVVVVTEEWRDMANRGDAKTGEKYQELIKDFSSQYIKQLDKKFGNGDGVLTYDEYYRSEAVDMPKDADASFVKEMSEVIKLAFNRLDLNKDKKIDEKEMTALLAAMDYDKDNNVDGCITINDYMRWSMLLGEKGKNFLDDLLKYNYNSFFGK